MSKSVVKKNDILVMSVFHVKTAGNSSKPHETEFFIKMERRMVRRNHSVELHKPESEFGGFLEGMGYDCFADMPVADVGSDRIACVGNMSASADIVGMEDIKSDSFAGFGIKCDSGKILGGEKFFRLFGRKQIKLGKGNAVLDDPVPDCGRIRRVGFMKFSYANHILRLR